jgi:hypothetical protein
MSTTAIRYRQGFVGTLRSAYWFTGYMTVVGIAMAVMRLDVEDLPLRVVWILAGAFAACRTLHGLGRLAKAGAEPTGASVLAFNAAQSCTIASIGVALF